MSASWEDYYTAKDWGLFAAEAEKHESPFLLVNLDIIKRNYEQMRKLYPSVRIYYAVKTNPCNEILSVLRDLGACYDTATVEEIDQVLALGVEPERISYGNTIKKARDIEYAYKRGVRLMASDSVTDLDNIASFAPEARVLVRLQTITGNTADHPLSRKFGVQPDMALELVEHALRKGLHVAGMSFHVGSQQRDIGAWETALIQIRHVFKHCKKRHPELRLEILDIGGGFPASYVNHAPPSEMYAQEINRYIEHVFGRDKPEMVMMEPGRGIAGDAGVLVTDVVLTEQKHKHAIDTWLYIDVGRFSGLTETYNEAIRYPVWTARKGPSTTNYIIAGPTCDSMDIIYEKYRVPLPLGMRQGDRLFLLSAGAYTHSTASIGFNGFPTPAVFFVGTGK